MRAVASAGFLPCPARRLCRSCSVSDAMAAGFCSPSASAAWLSSPRRPPGAGPLERRKAAGPQPCRSGCRRPFAAHNSRGFDPWCRCISSSSRPRFLAPPPLERRRPCAGRFFWAWRVLPVVLLRWGGPPNTTAACSSTCGSPADVERRRAKLSSFYYRYTLYPARFSSPRPALDPHGGLARCRPPPRMCSGS